VTRLAALLDELRPRFVFVKIEAERVRLRWAVPLSVFEELLAFAAKLIPLYFAIARYRRGERGAFERLPAWTVAFLSDDGRGVLRLPAGEVFITIETSELTLEIRQC
jgi:hypothetical protein